VPIEIRELVIRAVADAEGARGARPQAAAGRDEDELVRECVRQVLKVLEQEQER